MANMVSMSSSLIGGGGGGGRLEGTCLCLIVDVDVVAVDERLMSGVLIVVTVFFLLFVANTGKMYLEVMDLVHLGNRHCFTLAVIS